MNPQSTKCFGIGAPEHAGEFAGVPDALMRAWADIDGRSFGSIRCSGGGRQFSLPVAWKNPESVRDLGREPFGMSWAIQRGSI
jgi:hypothetical protein